MTSTKLFAGKLQILESELQNLSESFTKERIESIEQRIDNVNNSAASKLESTEQKLETINKTLTDNNDNINKNLSYIKQMF